MRQQYIIPHASRVSEPEWFNRRSRITDVGVQVMLGKHPSSPSFLIPDSASRARAKPLRAASEQLPAVIQQADGIRESIGDGVAEKYDDDAMAAAYGAGDEVGSGAGSGAGFDADHSGVVPEKLVEIDPGVYSHSIR